MILPNSRAYSALQKRLKDVASLHKNLPVQEEESFVVETIRFEELRMCFIDINLPQNRKFRTSLQFREKNVKNEEIGRNHMLIKE